MDLAPTPANVKAATRLLANVVAAIGAGVYRREDYFAGSGPAITQTFGDYADEWLKTLTLAKSTRRSYRTAINATWRPALGKELLAQIRYSDIKKALAAKAATVSGKTINNALIPLRAIFETARRDGLIAANPADDIENLAHQAPEADPFSREDRDAILAYMAKQYADKKWGEQVWTYYAVSFNTGLRPSEQIALRWSDIDWRAGTATISRAQVDWEEKATKTNTVRTVNLNDDAIAALTRQKAHTFMKDPLGAVFHNPRTGKPWPDEQVQRRRYFAPTLTALGLRHRDAYQTRHTFATLLLMGGINPAYIAKQLGHSSLAMVFRVYAKWIDRADKGAEAAKANAVLSSNRPHKAGEA